MINNSKILTVSYGTFSCTLEGFDDSFTTMKAIAEYFRDLAADDRYFGAEPPTPDAEMLARIAEREIERRVEAREHEGKIVLRAQEAAPAALLAGAEADAAVPAESKDSTDIPATEEAAPAPDLTAKAPEPVEPAAPVSAEDEVSEPAMPEAAPKTEGFTAPMPARPQVQAEPEPETAEAPAAEPTADLAEEASDVVEEAAELADEAVDVAEEPEEVAEEISEPDTLADFAEDEAEVTSPPAPAMAEVPHPDSESVAAKLSRIRSVVAKSEHPYADTTYTEDEHANDFLETSLADLNAALAADDAAELEADAAPEEVSQLDDVLNDLTAQSEETVAEQADDSALLANISSLSKKEDAAAPAEADTSGTDEKPQAQHTAPLELTDKDLVKAKHADPIEDTLAQLMADAMPEGETTAHAEDDADEEDDDRPLNARVMKMKTADLDAALAAGTLREADGGADAAGADTVNLFSDEDGEEVESTLSPEEEAELQRELAEVEADFAPEDRFETEADAEYEAEAEAEDEHEAELASDYDDEPEMSEDDMHATDAADDAHQFQDALDNAESAHARGVERLKTVEQTSDVSRIFDEVDQQREDPGSSERRNAIQHLRAAVAATRADQNAGVDISKDKDDSAYRSDLADVVRPRRPRPGTAARSQRPEMERPAPLKLVAEQRIDTPQEPVRPRRITTSDLADMESSDISDTDGSFAEFAEEMGAGSLPELLEAAAAYMADIEGRPQFSRPMLMGKLKEVEGESFSREDGLRSFGQLLRQGKLQKLKGGRFAVTDETDYRAEARNVG